MLTYGDGVSDIDIDELLRFHKKHGKALTMTAVQPEGRFGAMDLGEYDQLTTSWKNQKATEPGSMVVFLYASLKFLSILIRGMQRSGSGRPLRKWQPMANYMPTNTMDSGSPWICCATKCNLKNCGIKELHHGKAGNKQTIWRNLLG